MALFRFFPALMVLAIFQPYAPDLPLPVLGDVPLMAHTFTGATQGI